MDLETLNQILAALMDKRYFALADEVRAEITARQIAKDAILDFVER